MSKVLIDRDLLERAAYSLELAYEADTPTVRGIAAVLAAPSGTPELPVKAYYYESTTPEGVRTRSVGLEVRKTFADAPLVLESDALAGFAMRDARIVELEALASGGTNGDKYKAELYDEVWGEATGMGYSNVTMALAELAAIKAQEPVAKVLSDEEMGIGYDRRFGPVIWFNGYPKPGMIYAAPVAKPQAVMPERSNERGSDGELTYEAVAHNRCLDSVARLNAAPVQQVSVHEVSTVSASGIRFGNAWFSHERITGRSAASLNDGTCGMTARLYMDWVRAMLAAAPAAPAADAGLPYWEPCNPGCDPSFNGCRSVHCSEYCEGAREAIAAHRAAPAPGGE